MKLSISTSTASAARADLLVVTVSEDGARVRGDMPDAKTRALQALVKSSGFTGKEGKAVSLAAPKGFAAERVLLVGTGRQSADSLAQSADSLEATRRAAGVARAKSKEHLARSVAFLPPRADVEHALAAAEGFLLADYAFDRHKTRPAGAGKKTPLPVAILSTASVRAVMRGEMSRTRAVAAGVKLARDLGNEPANILTPAVLAERAVDLAHRHSASGVRCDVMLPAGIRRRGMGAFLAVAQGSENEPRFIHLSYKPPAGAKPGRRIALVGKGLTFDSGGISIKPSAGMEEMKFDMCGAAAVLGVFECLPDLGVGYEVHGYVAACDNMPSGSAVRPGDIVKSMSGRTIEVINTDAEGRLTLVDAITEALSDKPSVVVDLATLTGACAVALGAATGVMSNDKALSESLLASSRATGERAWPLPLFSDYKSQLKSEFADVKNLGDRYGGALTAGLFIREWVPESVPWAHMDIAGSAWTLAELPYCPKGATGVAVRTLAHWLRHLDT